MPKKKKNDEIPVAKSKNPLMTTIFILVGLLLLSSIFSGLAGLSSDNGFTGNVAVIPIKGTILGDGSNSLFTDESVASSTRIVKQIEEASANEQVQAIVLEINSAGGSAVASSEIANAIEQTNKPVIAWIREVGASGAYWIAASTDHIIAHELSITGSIGVQGSYLEFGGLLNDYNVTYQRLVGGKYKDTGSPFRELQADEEALLQQKIDLMHQVFIREVAKQRNMSTEEVQPYADGFFLLGVEALDAGLIDALGSKAEVMQYLEKELNETVELSWIVKEYSLVDLLGGMQQTHGLAVGKGFVKGLTEEGVTIRT